MTRSNRIRFNRNDYPLAHRVTSSPRLFAMLPGDEVKPLVASLEAAEKAAQAAMNSPFVADDITTEIHASLRKGKDIDVPAVLNRMASAGAARVAHEEAQTFLRGLPETYRTDLARFIDSCLPDLYAGLAAQLNDLLDRAEDVVADLSGAYDAEAAMDEGRAREFAAFRDLAGEYADIRESHLALLRSEDDMVFTNGSDLVAHAYFQHIHQVWPEIQRATVSGSVEPTGWRPLQGEPFALTEAANRTHFLNTVLRREALRPWIATAAQAKAQRKATVAATPKRPGDTIPNPVRSATGFYGGEARTMEKVFSGPASSTGQAQREVRWGMERPH